MFKLEHPDSASVRQSATDLWTSHKANEDLEMIERRCERLKRKRLLKEGAAGSLVCGNGRTAGAAV